MNIYQTYNEFSSCDSISRSRELKNTLEERLEKHFNRLKDIYIGAENKIRQKYDIKNGVWHQLEKEFIYNRVLKKTCGPFYEVTEGHRDCDNYHSYSVSVGKKCCVAEYFHIIISITKDGLENIEEFEYDKLEHDFIEELYKESLLAKERRIKELEEEIRELRE